MALKVSGAGAKQYIYTEHLKPGQPSRNPTGALSLNQRCLGYHSHQINAIDDGKPHDLVRRWCQTDVSGTFSRFRCEGKREWSIELVCS